MEEGRVEGVKKLRHRCWISIWAVWKILTVTVCSILQVFDVCVHSEYIFLYATVLLAQGTFWLLNVSHLLLSHTMLWSPFFFLNGILYIYIYRQQLFLPILYGWSWISIDSSIAGFFFFGWSFLLSSSVSVCVCVCVRPYVL